MAYIIEVTDHTFGNISVLVTDTSADKIGGATQARTIYERHQFSSRRDAFEYGERVLLRYLTRHLDKAHPNSAA